MGQLTTAAGPPALSDGNECCAMLLSSPLSEERAEALARDFAALADPVRLRLLNLLASAPAGGACVCELVEPLSRTQPTVSHHVRILVEAGLIVGEKRGRWVWYQPVWDRVAELRAALA